MQSKRYIATYIATFAMLLATTSFAGNRKTGINGASFLKIGVGARQVALGSAVTTLGGDPNMMFWNPAGIYIDGSKTAFALSHNEWLLAMNHDALSIAHNFEGIGTVGVGLIYIGLGDIAANRDVAPIPELEPVQADKATGATYDFSNLAVNLTLSHKFTDKLTLGASIKFIREKIDDQNASSVAGDFGAIYHTGWHDLAIGASLRNLGGDLTYYEFGAPIPLMFSIGASASLAKQENMVVTGLIDATKLQDSEQLYFGGLEWSISDKLMLRGGYKFNFSGARDNFEVDTTDEGASFGAGINLPWGSNEIRIDYAFTEFNVLDNTHRFSFSMTF